MAGEAEGRPRKLMPEVIERYLNRYSNLKLKAIWKIMRQDGLSASYETLRRCVRELSHVCVRGTWRKLGLEAASPTSRRGILALINFN